MANPTGTSGNTAPEQPTTLLTASEVATRLRVSRAYVYSVAREGRLRCITFGKAVRFDPRDVQAFLDHNRG